MENKPQYMKINKMFFMSSVPPWKKKIVKMQNSFFIVIVLMILTGNLSGQNFEYKLTNNSTDPTEIRTRADLFFAQVTSRASRDLFGSQLSGTYAMNRQFSAGLDIPYIYTDLSGGRQGTGIGDISE